MKRLGFFLLLISVVACDPYNFGFKKNPAYVLNEAFEAIANMDQERFLEVTGKEALCIYGNPEGITYLKEKLVIDPDNIKLVPTSLSKTYHKVPLYVGYWSYFSERYQVDVKDKKSSELLVKVIVDCDYGTDGERDNKYLNLPPKKYKRKECRLTKVVVTKFGVLPLKSRCQSLKVVL